MSRRIIVILAVAIVVGAVALLEANSPGWLLGRPLPVPGEAPQTAARVAVRNPASERDPMAARRDTLAIAWEGQTRTPPAPGPWIVAERASFADLAARGRYDLLLAPVYSDGYALDRVTRSILAARLAAELRQRGLRVPNPYVVQRALGEGARTPTPRELVELGGRLGVARIVEVAISHDRAGMLLVSVRVYQRTGPQGPLTPAEPVRLAPVRMADGAHPAAAAFAAVPEILRSAGVSSPAVVAASATPAAAALPESPAAALSAGGKEPSAHAIGLQLIASLAPLTPDRARERLFEHALLAALALPDDHPHARLLRARAWQMLGSRVAGLRALGTDSEPAAVAYREYLNGNLPQLTEAVRKVDDPVHRLWLELDLHFLRSSYGLPGAHEPGPWLKAFMDRYPAWAPLVERRAIDNEAWSDGEIMLPWVLLDRDLPLPGASAAERLRGMQAIGRDVDAAAITKGALAHIRRLRSEDAALAECLDASIACTRSAYLDLLEALTVSDAGRRVLKRGTLQALYDEALEEVRALKPELDGEVSLLYAEARVLASKAERSEPRQREAAYAAALPAAIAAAWFEQGLSRTSRAALSLLGIPSRESAPFLEAYFHDLPTRDFWVLSDGYRPLGRPTTPAERGRIARDMAAATIGGIDWIMHAMAWMTPDDKRKWAADVRDARFRGHPQRFELVEQLEGATGGDPLPRLEAALEERPDLWHNRYRLGVYQIEQRDDYDAAYEVLIGFQGFKDPRGQNAVGISNWAYDAGRLFFWRGRLEEARAFFRISAGLQTGSAASITSEARLHLLDGDFRRHAEFSLLRGQRYNDPYGYRDYLGWLFAYGLQKEGWAGFAQLHDKFAQPEMWLAADVGHRAAGRAWPAVREWLLSEPFRSSAVNDDRFALRLAIMQNSVDRAPAADLAETMRQIEGTPTARVEGRALSMPHPLGGGRMMVQPSQFRAAARGESALTHGQPVASQYVLFAEAYAALRNGDFAGAIEKFDVMATYYPIEGQSLTQIDPYALAYFAWAAARSGDRLGLESFIGSLPREEREFDVSLASAFFAGLRGEHAEALRHLKRAFDNRPGTEKRPIPTEFQWAEACEWLSEATGNRQYLELALEWARVHQRLQPMMAWAYAFEARHSSKESDRIRALGIALHLDPNSERIAGLPEGLKNGARLWFERHTPFDLQRANTARKT